MKVVCFTFFFLFIPLTLKANSYLVREVENLITIAESVNEDQSPECETFHESINIQDINDRRTTGVEACYRPQRDPLPYTALRPGQHRLMTQDNWPRQSGPLEGRSRGSETGNYLLRRLANTEGRENYEVIMNVDFQGSPVHTAYMRDKVRQCFREMQPYMRGPNGENLSIKILSPAETELLNVPKPNPIPITATERESDFRGNAGTFGTNFTCSTIGHEFFHHMGLCDEYHEGVIDDPQTKVKADWSCRAVTSTPSFMRNKDFSYYTTVPLTSRCSCDEYCNQIMTASNPRFKSIYLSMDGIRVIGGESSMWQKFCTEEGRPELVLQENIPDRAFSFAEETSPGTTYFNSYNVGGGNGRPLVWKRKIKCECPPGHPYCGRLVSDFRRRATGRIPLATCPGGTRASDREPSIGNQGESRVEGTGDQRVLIVTNGNPRGSLFRPQHFYKVLSGNCEGGAPAYEACSPYAVMPEGPQCSTMPAFCHDDRIYLNGPRGTSAAPTDRRRTRGQ